MLNSPSLTGWPAALTLCGFLAISHAHAETWAITDAAHPLIVPPGLQVRIIRLDEQERLEAQLTRVLPTVPQQAQAAFQQYLQTPQGRRLQANLVKAQQDLTDAWSLGIEKIPAVVVDKQYVVYGQPDVPAALKAIEQTRRR